MMMTKNNLKSKSHTRIIMQFLLTGFLKFSSMEHNQIFWIGDTIHKFLPKPLYNTNYILLRSATNQYICHDVFLVVSITDN